jgi:phenylalanyl-tRNA synthetase alpha chain
MATTSAATTETCESTILTFLSDHDSIDDSYPWSMEHSFDPLVVIGVVNSLLTEGYVTTNDLSTSFYTLTPEGEMILRKGSQEMMVYKAIVSSTDQSLTMEEIEADVGKDLSKIGLGNCLKNKWITKNGDRYAASLSGDIVDVTQKSLQSLSDGNFTKDAIDEKVSAVGGAMIPSSFLCPNIK